MEWNEDQKAELTCIVYTAVTLLCSPLLLVIPVFLHDGCLALFPVPGLLLCRGCKLGRGLETDVLYNVRSCMAVLAFSGACMLLHSYNIALTCVIARRAIAQCSALACRKRRVFHMGYFKDAQPPHNHCIQHEE